MDVNATVHFSGVNEAAKTVTALQEKINEAKMLAEELVSLVERLEVKVEM